MSEGYQAHEKKRADEAVKKLELLLSKLASDTPVEILSQRYYICLFLGVNYKRLGNYEHAFKYYYMASKHEINASQRYETNNALGKLAYILNRQEAAIGFFVLALECTNDETERLNLLHHLGHAILDFGNQAELSPKLIAQIPEYKRSISGQKHAFQQENMMFYIQQASERLPKLKAEILKRS